MSKADKKVPRKPKDPPPDALRCAKIKANGERCKTARLKDGERCAYHTKGFLDDARRAQMAEINARRAVRRAQIEAAKAYLPLQTREQLAGFANLLMVEADEGTNPFPEDMEKYLNFQLKCIADADTGAPEEALIIQVPADA